MPFPLIPLAAKGVGWAAGATGLSTRAIKWGLAIAAAALVGWLAWRAYDYVTGLRDEKARLEGVISERDKEIGGLQVQLAFTAQVAEQNAAELVAEQIRTQNALDLMSRQQRDAQRRQGLLEEALNEIDKWKPEDDGPIGPGLRGVLDGLRRKAAGSTDGRGPEGGPGLRDGGGLPARVPEAHAPGR